MDGLELKMAHNAGHVLRVARVVAGRQLQDVARAAGISAGHLSSVESGRDRLTPAVAERVMRAIIAEGALA